MEKWVSVEGYPNYEVSDKGRVRSLDRRGADGRLLRGVNLKTYINSGQKVAVLRSGDRSVKRIPVGRLLAESFLGATKNDCIIYKDNDRANATLTNIDFGTIDDLNKNIPQDEFKKPSLPEEEWRGIVGYEGLYEVSNKGRIWRIPRWISYPDRMGERFYRGEIQKFSIDKGYFIATLVSGQGDKGRRFAVHRLVAKAWLNPPESEDLIVLHGPAGQKDNSVENLSWGTHSDNERDKIRDGTHFQLNKRYSDCGHILSPPNLNKGNLPYRNCRACKMARDVIRNHQGLSDFHEEIADIYYSRIMTGAASERLKYLDLIDMLRLVDIPKEQ